MRFIVFVKATKASEAGELPSAELIQAMGKFNAEMVKAGVLLAGDGLQPTKSATRLSFQGGPPQITDGPFAEIKEIISGYWILQARTQSEVVEWIRRAPMPPGSELEIRRISEPEDFAPVMSQDDMAKERALGEAAKKNAR